MWIAALKNLSHAKLNEAKTANNQSSIITNHLEGKPNQTQFKPDPGKVENEPKKCYNNELQRFCPDVVKKTNPIQTQFKPKTANLSPRDNQSSIYPRGLIDVPLCFYALMFLALFLRSLRHYSLDYLVRRAVEYPCCMSLVKNKCNSHIRRNQNAD